VSLSQAVLRHKKNLGSLQGPISVDTEWSVRLRWGIPRAFGGCHFPFSIPVLESTQIDSSGVWCQWRQWSISPWCHWQVMLQIRWPCKEGKAGRGEQPKGGSYSSSLLSAMCGSCCRVRCFQRKNRKEGLLGALSFSLLLWFGIVLATLYAKCQCLISTSVKVSPELDLLQFLKLISAVE